MSSQQTQHIQTAPSQRSEQANEKKVRGPFPIEVLAKILGISVEQVLRYQEQGLIPQRRAWHTKGPAMFYKSDVDRIAHAQRKEKNTTGKKRKIR